MLSEIGLDNEKTYCGGVATVTVYLETDDQLCNNSKCGVKIFNIKASIGLDHLESTVGPDIDTVNAAIVVLHPHRNKLISNEKRFLSGDAGTVAFHRINPLSLFLQKLLTSANGVVFHFFRESTASIDSGDS